MSSKYQKYEGLEGGKFAECLKMKSEEELLMSQTTYDRPTTFFG